MFLQSTPRMAPSLANMSRAGRFLLTGHPAAQSPRPEPSLFDLMLDWERFYCDPRDDHPAYTTRFR